MENKKTERIAYVDTVKAIAMISVVVVHACTNHSSTYLATNAYLIRVLSAYAMPVFFFINGFLYRNKNPEHPIKEIVRKVKSYYLPFLAYNLFYLLMHNLFAYLHMVDENNGNGFYSLKDYLKHFILAVSGHREYFSGALWFLGSILTVNAIIIVAEFLILKCTGNKRKFFILGILAVMCMIAGNSGYVPSAMKLAMSCSSMIYFYFGMLYRQAGLNDFFTKKRYVYISLSIVVNLLVSYNKLCNPFGINSDILIVILDYVNAFIAIIAIMLIAQIPVVEKSRILNVIGKNTLDIMALHFMVFKLVSLIIIVCYELPINRLADYPVLLGVGGAWWVLYTIVGIAIPTLFSILRHNLFKKREKG